MKKSFLILILLIVTVSLFGCSKDASITDYEKLVSNFKDLGFLIAEEDVGKDILQGQRKWLIINDEENLSVYLYKTNKEMEEDASYIDEGGTSYTDGKKNVEISWISDPHFYKKGNIIVLYVGKNQEIINTLEEIIDLQFAGKPKQHLSDRRPMVMIKGELYLDTNREGDINPRCGVMDGEISSTVAACETPTQDNQSNFGDGYEYQFVGGNSIDILMNNKWIRFEKEILDAWGIQLTTTKITPYGLVLVCIQSEGNPSGDLQTGSLYWLEVLIDNKWIPVEMLPSANDIGWTAEAYIINMNDITEWEVNWEWLYGELPIGRYRIGKEIMDFRSTGGIYDTLNYYADFEIVE